MAYLIVHDFSEIFRPGTVEPDQTAWNFAVSHFYHPGDSHRIGPAHSTVWLWLKIKVPKGNQKIITFGIVFFRSILGVQEFWALFNCVHFWWPSAEMVLVIFLGWLVIVHHRQGGNHEVWLWKQELIDQDGIDAGHLQRGRDPRKRPKAFRLKFNHWLLRELKSITMYMNAWGNAFVYNVRIHFDVFWDVWRGLYRVEHCRFVEG